MVPNPCSRKWCWTRVSGNGAEPVFPEMVPNLCFRKWCRTRVSGNDAEPVFPEMMPNPCFRKWCRTRVSGNGAEPAFPEMVPNPVFPETATIFLLMISKQSQSANGFFHYRSPLFPVQLHTVSRVNIVAKSNRFLFPMILVWDRKRVNIARYSVEDHLIGWWVERARRIRLIFSRWEADAQTSADQTELFHSVSSVRSEADRAPNRVESHFNSPNSDPPCNLSFGFSLVKMTWMSWSYWEHAATNSLWALCLRCCWTQWMIRLMIKSWIG